MKLLTGISSAAVASLPPEMGGISQVDVRVHAKAMQAKVAVMLLHPIRRTWKNFMRAKLERALPGQGEAVLVQHSKQPHCTSFHGRHAHSCSTASSDMPACSCTPAEQAQSHHGSGGGQHQHPPRKLHCGPAS